MFFRNLIQFSFLDLTNLHIPSPLIKPIDYDDTMPSTQHSESQASPLYNQTRNPSSAASGKIVFSTSQKYKIFLVAFDATFASHLFFPFIIIETNQYTVVYVTIANLTYRNTFACFCIANRSSKKNFLAFSFQCIRNEYDYKFTSPVCCRVISKKYWKF